MIKLQGECTDVVWKQGLKHDSMWNKAYFVFNFQLSLKTAQHKYRLNYVTSSTNCNLAMELLLYAFEFRQLYKDETVVSSFCALAQDSL